MRRSATVINVETLETERLLLEPWDERHRASWRSICRDEDVMRFIGTGELWPMERADEVFDGMLGHWQEHGFGWRSVLDKPAGHWLGFVGLNVVGPGVVGVGPEEVEIGWWLVPSSWGHGYASEGAAVARDEGFERIGLDQVVARLLPANGASARVAHKIGLTFDREATGRRGEPLHVLALDRDRWERNLR
jgi:RimJ/RimL family protein N-acetyltransferase